MKTNTKPAVESGIPIINRLRKAEPNREIAIVAVSKITTIGDMVRFFDSYAIYLRREGAYPVMMIPKRNIRAALPAVYGGDLYANDTSHKRLAVLEELDMSEYTKE